MAQMPWGKHKGRPLEEIPVDYLGWLLDEAENMKPWLREAVRQEFERRLAGPAGSGNGLPANLPDIVRTWYRKLTLDYHPDRGGSNEAMKALNDAHDRLKKALDIPP
jgi:hypothetical protein